MLQSRNAANSLFPSPSGVHSSSRMALARNSTPRSLTPRQGSWAPSSEAGGSLRATALASAGPPPTVARQRSLGAASFQSKPSGVGVATAAPLARQRSASGLGASTASAIAGPTRQWSSAVVATSSPAAPVRQVSERDRSPVRSAVVVATSPTVGGAAPIRHVSERDRSPVRSAAVVATSCAVGGGAQIRQVSERDRSPVRRLATEPLAQQHATQPPLQRARSPCRAAGPSGGHPPAREAGAFDALAAAKARSTTPRMADRAASATAPADGPRPAFAYGSQATATADGPQPSFLYGSQGTVPGTTPHLTTYGPPNYMPEGTPTTAPSPHAPELLGTWESRSMGSSTAASAFGTSSSASAAGGLACGAATRPHTCSEPCLPGARPLHRASPAGSAFTTDGGSVPLRADAAQIWREQAGLGMSSDGPPPPAGRFSSEPGVSLRDASPSPPRAILTPPELGSALGLPAGHLSSALGLPAGLAPATAPADQPFDDTGRLGGLLGRMASEPALLGGSSAMDSDSNDASASKRKPWPRGPSRSLIQREASKGQYSVSSSLDMLRAKVDAIQHESRRLKSIAEDGGRGSGAGVPKAPAPFFAFDASSYAGAR